MKNELRAGYDHSVEADAGQSLQQRVDELQALVAQQSGQLESLDAERNSLLSISTSLQEEVVQLRQALSERTAVSKADGGNAGAESPDGMGTDDLRGALEKVTRERDELSLQLNGLEEDEVTLKHNIKELEEQLAVQKKAAAEKIAETTRALEQERQHIAAMREESEARNSQLESSRVEASQKDVDNDLLHDELELVRQRNLELQQLVEQGEERIRAIEGEYQDSARKSHEDLKRKNDIEKEMQGQIDRLRKQLEQTSRDYQKSRIGAQEDLDNLRDELHAERQARAEERAQMAARQRELKEQLAAVATEHEVNFTKQSDVIEEAVDAVRTEERSRLQGVLDAHAATEEQLAKVQQDLQQAHAEMVVLRHQERERHQADMKLMEGQYRQAETTIKQLESQLRELTRERDGALEEQKALLEKIGALRGEVEVARGLINVSRTDHKEDPDRLRRQLDETRRNVEIAVRLRAEAEAARDRLLEERNTLQAQIEGNAETVVSLHVPSLDAELTTDGIDGALQDGERKHVAQDGHLHTMTIQPSAESESSGGRMPGWLGWLAGLLVAGVIGAGGWWFIGGKATNPVTVPDGTAAEPRILAQHEGLPDGEGSVETQDMTPPSSVSPPPVISESRHVSVPKVAGSGISVAAPENRSDNSTVPVATSEADIQISTRSARQSVLRTYSDTLKIGGHGPVMVEFAPAGYFMGSYGNSLNFQESPRHLVKLAGFSISKYEVTFNDYDRFARATGRRLPYDETWGRGERPVINVSWNDAEDYVDWLSRQTGHKYRLPSEAEWEYAVRGGSYWMYWWMAAEDDVASDGVWANCYNCGSEWDGVKTAPVGKFPANAYGLYDMAGNVQEWVADCYHESYDGAPQDGSIWVSPYCSQRVVRGGGYTSPLDTLRSARRGQLDQDTRLDNLGFRVVREN